MEDSLSSSVELIPDSPSPERAAPDRTRLLTWHTPRQPRPPAGHTRDSSSEDSDSDSPAVGGRRRQGGPAPLLSVSSPDSPDTPAARRRPLSPEVISDDDDDAVTAPPASPRTLVISDDESDDDDAVPCSQQRRSAAPRSGSGRRSEDGIPAPSAAPAAASVSGDVSTGQDGDTSGASMVESDQSWGSSNGTVGRSPQEDGAQDPRDRAQRLYSKYTIKKRTSPPVEPPQTGDRQTDAESDRTPAGRHTAERSHGGHAAPADREKKTTPSTAVRPEQSLPGAGRAGPPASGPSSRTVIIVPTEAPSSWASGGASSGASGGVSSGVSSGAARGTQGGAREVRSSPDVSPDTGSRTAGQPQPTSAAQEPRGTAGRAGPTAGSTGAAAATRPAEQVQTTDDGPDLSHLSTYELEQHLKQKEMVARVSNLSALPDGGRRLRGTIERLRTALEQRRSAPASQPASRPAPAAYSSSSSGGGGGGGGGMSQLQRVQNQISQKRMEYSTSAHRADAAMSAQLQRDIFRLEAEMMRLQVALNGAGPAGGRNPFNLGGSTVSRPPAFNRPRGEAGRPTGPPPAGRGFFPPQTDSLESALRRGQLTTAVMTEEQRRLEAEARESLRDFGQIRPQLTAALLASNPELSRLYGGRMTDARHREATNVTTEVLERLHRSLETCPPVTAAEVGPACLNVPLMPHQQYALSWLEWREKQLPAGGILADDMGLGKTLTMIAHCVRSAELDREAAKKAKQDEADKENVGEDGIKKEKDEDGQTEKEKADFADGKDVKWLSKKKPAKEEGTAVPTLPPSQATLVICPASVLLQWEAEVKRRTTGGLTTIIYHGPNRRADQRRLRKADFVMTTYDLVRQEVEKDNLFGANKADRSPLMSYTWRRIILDEAHQIRNKNTKASKAVCELQADRRWLLSGTPIQNGRDDFFSLMRFLHAAPFDEHAVWKRWIDKSPRGDERLSLIVKAMVLRRTKDQMSVTTGKPLVALPPRQKRSHIVELDKREREVYDKVFAFCRSSLQEFIKLQEEREYEKELKSNPLARPPPGLNATLSSAAAPGMGPGAPDGDPSGMGRKGSIKQHHLLVQLLRLRQICCHPGLAKTVMTSSDRESAGVDAEEDAADLEAQLDGLSLSEPSAAGRQASVLSADNPVFSRDWCSAKLRRLMLEVQTIVDAGEEKVVVVSQWTSMLDIVREHLSLARVASCTISGSVKMSVRQELIDAFNGSSRRGPRVMLLSLLAGGVGLNLVGGNHLFIMDPHWNPQLEEQAGDRIYRVGQRRSVFIHRFVCKDTLEERILELQQKKLNIARGVLSGDKQAASHRLTMSDLKTLFNMQ